VQPLIDIIGQIPGYENIPEKFKKILEAEQPPQPPPKTDFTGPGTYSLIDRNSGKAVDLNGGNREDGTKIQILYVPSNMQLIQECSGKAYERIVTGRAEITTSIGIFPMLVMISTTSSAVRPELTSLINVMSLHFPSVSE
jgi:hypothetical protein